MQYQEQIKLLKRQLSEEEILQKKQREENMAITLNVENCKNLI